jgi:hypothetical protein
MHSALGDWEMVNITTHFHSDPKKWDSQIYGMFGFITGHFYNGFIMGHFDGFIMGL